MGPLKSLLWRTLWASFKKYKAHSDVRCLPEGVRIGTDAERLSKGLKYLYGIVDPQTEVMPALNHYSSIAAALLWHFSVDTPNSNGRVSSVTVVNPPPWRQ